MKCGLLGSTDTPDVQMSRAFYHFRLLILFGNSWRDEDYGEERA